MRCPAPAPVQFTVDYLAQGRSFTASLPGFADLGQVPYSGCPRHGQQLRLPGRRAGPLTRPGRPGLPRAVCGNGRDQQHRASRSGDRPFLVQ